MYWDNIYKEIAQTIDKVIVEPQFSYIFFQELLKVISDVKSDNDGYLISITFLYDISYLLLESYRRDNHEAFIPRFVKKVNSFTVSNYGNLNSFISSIDWDSGGIPENWIILSQNVGYDLIQI